MGARDTALAVLVACRRQGAWSDGALKHQIARDGLDRREAALASQLCYGVLQNRMLLDAWLDRFVRGRLHPVTQDILRLAAYQLLFLEKIPPSAAVNEAVEQTKRYVNQRAAGLVNAVLRNLLRSRDRLPLPEDLATRYSHPAALVSLLEENVGTERLEALLESHNRTTPTYLQINTVRADTASVCALLTGEGYTVTPHPWLSDCVLLSGGGVEGSAAFREGLVYVQDPAARLAVLVCGLRPGQRVLDCCAAPGGKSFAAAIALQNRGSLTACDLHSHKISLIEKGAQRLGLDCIRALQQDAGVFRPDWAEHFDTVLCDVPCSGLGVIRKKPDIRYKDLSTLEQLPALQLRILENQANYVNRNGVLLYSTCTVLRRENEDVIGTFLQRHPDFSAEAFTLPNGEQAAQGHITLLPCTHDTDGFFICKLRRQA